MQFFFWPRPLGPRGGVKRSNNIFFQLQSQFQRFLYQTLCVFSQMRYKTYQTGFSFCCLGHAQGLGLWGAGCAQVVNFFFQTWSCGISNRRGWRAEQNASKIFILGSNWWPWGEVKGQISLNFGYHVNFKDFYTKLCVCSHKWKIQNTDSKSTGLQIYGGPGSLSHDFKIWPIIFQGSGSSGPILFCCEKSHYKKIFI